MSVYLDSYNMLAVLWDFSDCNYCKESSFVVHQLQHKNHLKVLSCHNLRNVNQEAVARRCSVKKVFLEISESTTGKHYRKTPVSESFLIKLQASGLQLYKKKRLWHKCFPGNFAKFLRTSFLTEHLRWLLL